MVTSDQKRITILSIAKDSQTQKQHSVQTKICIRNNKLNNTINEQQSANLKFLKI